MLGAPLARDRLHQAQGVGRQNKARSMRARMPPTRRMEGRGAIRSEMGLEGMSVLGFFVRFGLVVLVIAIVWSILIPLLGGP